MKMKPAALFLAPALVAGFAIGGLAAGGPARAASPPPALVQLAQAPAKLQTFSRGTVVITTRNGPQTFSVDIAVTDDQKEQGLMFRQSMRPDAGMWFDYSHDVVPVSFWMKNTYLPLDIVFVGADGRILSIHERAVPLSEAPMDSGGPVSGVLELNGGTAARLGLQRGDPVSVAAS